jgi:hypothetical protein
MTREEIAVKILCSLTATQDSMRAIGSSADDASIDPFVFAAKSAVQFADALINELREEPATLNIDINSLLHQTPAIPKPKRTYKRKIKNES